MRKALFTLAAGITTSSAFTSFYLATLPSPTEAQKNLANTTNTIMVAGTTAIFGLLDDKDRGDQDKDNQR